MSQLARQLIAENKKTRSTYLDLGNCGMTEVPEEIGGLVWLETLILSSEWWGSTSVDDINQKSQSQNKGKSNTITEFPFALANLFLLTRTNISID